MPNKALANQGQIDLQQVAVLTPREGSGGLHWSKAVTRDSVHTSADPLSVVNPHTAYAHMHVCVHVLCLPAKLSMAAKGPNNILGESNNYSTCILHGDTLCPVLSPTCLYKTILSL